MNFDALKIKLCLIIERFKSPKCQVEVPSYLLALLVLAFTKLGPAQSKLVYIKFKEVVNHVIKVTYFKCAILIAVPSFRVDFNPMSTLPEFYLFLFINFLIS